MTFPCLQRPNTFNDKQRSSSQTLTFPQNVRDKYSLSHNDSLSLPAGKIVEKKFRFPNLDAASGPSVQDFGHHAGYYGLPHSHGERKIILVSNILYIDQPLETGFSHASNENDIPHDEARVGNDMFDFLQAFFKQHSQFVENDLYITGESYSGHYIPAIASRIHQANKANEGIHINLKGFAIGNGLTNPEIQYAAYTDFALENGLINSNDYNRINMMVPQCLHYIQDCGNKGGQACETAFFACNEDIFEQILAAAGNVNYYDIRKKCDRPGCYDFSSMETFLNKKEVRKALGVGDLRYVSCNEKVYSSMRNDWMKNLEVGIPALLEDGIRMLVYAGEKDLICNWLGNERWVDAMKWSGQAAFMASPNVSFVVDGQEAGKLRSHEPLSFLKIHEAGHLVPMDQPKAALEMLTRWMQGKLTIKETGGAN